jgi:hypothetical protein
MRCWQQDKEEIGWEGMPSSSAGEGFPESGGLWFIEGWRLDENRKLVDANTGGENDREPSLAFW